MVPEAEADGAEVDGVVAAGPEEEVPVVVSAAEAVPAAGVAALEDGSFESGIPLKHASVDYPIVYIILNSKSMAYKIAKQRDDNL